MLTDLIENEPGTPAVVLGNGINRYTEILPDWKKLLASIPDEGVELSLDGLSNTEVYDLVELHAKDYKLVKRKVAESLRLSNGIDLSIHRQFLRVLISNKIPVLTTNFDTSLEHSVGANLYHLGEKGFTRFYPWQSYYGMEVLESPLSGFGIWKIHGDVRYPDSIRLGLTDYMGSAERARKMFHNGPDRLFQGKSNPGWSGRYSWLHIWFNMPLVFIGLGCGADETFIRWLLIERRRFRNMRNENMDVTYVSVGQPKGTIKNLLENLGGRIKEINSWDEIYKVPDDQEGGNIFLDWYTGE